MATSAALATVQNLYISYYGRPADVAGQRFWADKLDAAQGSLVGIIDAFATSAEAQALYGAGTTVTDRITVLYQNILGRAPDVPGLNYYVDQVNRGKVSLGNVALSILDGVKPGTSDAPLAANRLSLANAFTAQVSTVAKSYDGDAAAAIARTFLKQVTGDAATVTGSTAKLPAFLNTIGVASKEPAKFAGFVTNGLLTNTGIVSSTLSQANLDEVLKALTPTTGTTAGKIIDGYIKGATVFADANGDGKQDPGEVSATTDDKGNFVLPAGAVGNLVSKGGTDISTNLPFKGVLTAPAGSTVVNPLTTLVNNLVQSGQDAAAAQQKVAQALGLPANVDVTTFDPLNVATSSTASVADKQAALALQKAAATVANILVQTAGAVAGAAPGSDSAAVASQAAQTLSNLINGTASGQTLDLTSTATLNAVLNDAAQGLNAADQAQLAQVQTQVVQVMLQTNEALEKVGTDGADPIAALANMAKAQVVAQGEASTALQNAVQTGDTTQATTNFTGDKLDQAVETAPAGTIGEATPPPAPAPAPAPAPTPAPAPGGGGGGGGGGVPTFTLQLKSADADGFIKASEATTTAVLVPTVTSSTLNTIQVSGLKKSDSTALSVAATKNTTTGNYEFDATQFKDGILALAAQDIFGQISNLSVTLDTTALTLVISDVETKTTSNIADGTTTFTFTFSENLNTTTFTESDITVTGGTFTPGSLTKVSDSTYTLVVTPTAGVDAGTITVAANAKNVNDVAGNAGADSAKSLIQLYDTLAPVFSSLGTASPLENQNQLYSATTTGAPGSVTYSLKDPTVGDANLLNIDGSSGVVTLKAGSLDFEGGKNSY
ncbi:MAG: DUF4214 domain-containing protein, partial [Burkholderiaceae bacterium]|nr:DUF4214 domain-containing protein [Burkholderiaceae bacterium]